MSTTDPKNAYPEPCCDACRCRQDDHRTIAQRMASDTVREFPPREGEVVSTCVMCECEVEPAEFVAHSGMAMNHPDIQQKIYATNATLHSLRRLNGAAWIATRIMEGLTQDTRMVIHPCQHARCPGCDSRIAIHVTTVDYGPVGSDLNPMEFQARAIYEELERRGFEHDRSHDFVNLQDGSSRTRYRHPITGYELEIVVYQESDPEAHPPFSADQVNEIRANFWQQLSGTGASS